MSRGTDRLTNEVIRSLVPPTSVMKKIGHNTDTKTYLREGKHSFTNLKKFAYLTPEHSVLDVGCGCGRVAIHLTQFLKPRARYVGIDVVASQIDWCTNAISPHFENFTFYHTNFFNKFYNRAGAQFAGDVEFPIPAEQRFDLVILSSVFTHMLPNDVEAYLREIFRRLKVGGILFVSFFILNEDSKRNMAEGRAEFQFIHQGDGYYSHHRRVHERAVAYEEDRVWRMLADAGFSRDKVIYGRWSGRFPAQSGQDIVVCSKQRS